MLEHIYIPPGTTLTINSGLAGGSAGWLGMDEFNVSVGTLLLTAASARTGPTTLDNSTTGTTVRITHGSALGTGEIGFYGNGILELAGVAACSRWG